MRCFHYEFYFSIHNCVMLANLKILEKIKKRFLIPWRIVSLMILIASCAKPDPNTYIQHLNGYWEIDKVITAFGQEKQYTFNQDIEFIEVSDSSGIRKKVRPQFDGSFLASNNTEKFVLKIENDSLRLHYTTAMHHWKETVISAKENELIIKNQDGNLYFYKTYQKLELQ